MDNQVMTDRQRVAQRRLASQRLVGAPLGGPEETVRWFGAMQAQEYAAVKWAIAQRTGGLTHTAIDEALADGRLIRTHLMRPTWHLVLPEDIRWIHGLTAARVIAGNAGRSRQLELDEATYGRANALFAKALSGGRRLTRPQLAGVLEAAGISAEGQRMPHLLMRAELDQVIGSGGRSGKEFTYALLDERVPPGKAFDRNEALAELTWRYFRSHGPATAHDMAWWSGLTVKDVREGLAANRHRLEEVRLGDTSYWQAPGEPGASNTAHLLPVYDEHWVAYRDHRLSYDTEAFPDGGPEEALLRTNPIAVDGLVVGYWRRTVTAKRIAITADLRAPVDARQREALRDQAECYGAFWGLSVSVEGL